ncbi:enoyl-CoA hydratase/isomerase family protein [Sphingosinicellaceae bacterium]|nr:enoyl-CoA hydratase/isomerase family protein [Sphingosinicellaceae bacterium]
MTLETSTDDAGTRRIALNRPDKHNAFEAATIAELTAAFTAASTDTGVRAVVLTGNGPSFCAGADAAWMRASADLSETDNAADALRLSDMLLAVDTCAKPVIVVAHGFVFGGGVGLVACADLVVVRPSVQFRLSEVRLGLTPATISPFVVAKIGASAARRYFLTAEDFGAADAVAMGLAHVESDDPEAQIATWLGALAQGAPGAIADAKALIRAVADRPVTDELRTDTAARIAARRASPEGREGLAAFIERRKPAWTTP